MLGLWLAWFALVATLVVTVILAALRPPAESAPSDSAMIERGRVLVAFGSCNDCHTPGWLENDGRVPMSRWLTGNTVGFRGPWGTIYPINVRLWFGQISEDDWLHAIATRAGHPPMKWTDLRTLSLDDQRAIYRFIKSLGPAGTPAPLDVPPGREPKTPFINVIPQQSGSQGAVTPGSSR
jgi:mono/diheme cytochrome c family protein